MRDGWAAAAVLALAACGGKDGGTAKAPAPAAEAGHAHAGEEKGAHGGEVVVLGAEAAHAEVVHDPAAKRLTVHLTGPDGKTPMPVEAPVLNLATKEGPVQATLVAVSPGPDGKAAAWTVEHAALASDPLDGRLRVTAAGQTHQVPLSHEH
jgi:hypothetical protein